MNLLELNKIFEGKYIEKREKEEKQIQVTEENVIKFRELLMINDSFTEGLNRTESAVEYFKTYELLDKVVSDDLKEELFYIAKTGFFFEGIPSKVVYLLQRFSYFHFVLIYSAYKVSICIFPQNKDYHCLSESLFHGCEETP